MKNDTTILDKQIAKEVKTGNVKSAIELCQIGLQKDPTNANLHLRLGDLYLTWHLDIYTSSQYVDEAITSAKNEEVDIKNVDKAIRIIINKDLPLEEYLIQYAGDENYLFNFGTGTIVNDQYNLINNHA